MRYIELKDGTIYSFDTTKIMGILNITGDSFYAGSRLSSIEAAIDKAMNMIQRGADIIDIGGESTRPGSEPITVEEELEKVIPIIQGIREKDEDILISVDTYRSQTAEESIKAGADIINDISAMTFDNRMSSVIAEYNVPIVLMHIKGTPKNMQLNPYYNDVVEEVKEFLDERVEFSLQNGIKRNKMILDVGIGFGKGFDHNLQLIRNIDEFLSFGIPILLGVSRKSFIGEALGGIAADERLEGTLAISSYAALKGIDMVRVHDVLENRRALQMIEVLL